LKHLCLLEVLELQCVLWVLYDPDFLDFLEVLEIQCVLEVLFVQLAQ
jgi:hypothetical protein